jgi:DNA-binding NarL/FixJ family response regulator
MGGEQVVHHNGVRIQNCLDLRWLPTLVRSLDAGWVLAGEDIDDRDIQHGVASARAVREDLSLAVIGPLHDWRRGERWLRRGCRVYLEDSVAPRRAGEAIRAAQELGVTIMDRVFFQVSRERAAGLAPRLTRREEDALKLLRRGLRNREIAEAMHVTENTVEFHVRHLLSKFSARSRVEVVERASELGLA